MVSGDDAGGSVSGDEGGLIVGPREQCPQGADLVSKSPHSGALLERDESVLQQASTVSRTGCIDVVQFKGAVFKVNSEAQCKKKNSMQL